jgi:hypothetical protein
MSKRYQHHTDDILHQTNLQQRYSRKDVKLTNTFLTLYLYCTHTTLTIYQHSIKSVPIINSDLLMWY